MNQDIAIKKVKLAYANAKNSFDNDSMDDSSLTPEAKANLQMKTGLKDAEISLRTAQLNLN